MENREFICSIADIKIKIQHIRNSIGILCKPYYTNSEKADISLVSTNEGIDDIAKENDPIFTRGYLETILLGQLLAEETPNFSAFLLHSVTIDIDGTGVAFSALSGTGKSTHLANWCAYLNGTQNMPEQLEDLIKESTKKSKRNNLQKNLKIVNGDKPIVRFFDEEFCRSNGLEIPEATVFGIPYAYGTPWCGKEGLGCNMRTPLKHICFIERSETNYVTKIDKNDAVNRIMQQVYMPKDPVALVKTLELVNRLISYCDLWIIHCNMDIESAEVAYNAIFGNNENK